MVDNEYITKFLSKDFRFDGRKRLDVREVSVETGVIGSAEGSARVKFGDTEVLAGVKFEISTPYPDSPDAGNLMVNAELTPLSDPAFETGPPSETAIELARVVDRGLRESGAIDFSKLVITAGEKVWTVIVDVVSINNDGNLIDVCGLAAIAALKHAKFPNVVDDKIDYKKLTDKGIPLNEIPVPVTVFKIGDSFIVDPIREEEKALDSRVTFTITSKGDLCSLQKGGSHSISSEDLEKMIDIAIDTSKKVRGSL